MPRASLLVSQWHGTASTPGLHMILSCPWEQPFCSGQQHLASSTPSKPIPPASLGPNWHSNQPAELGGWEGGKSSPLSITLPLASLLCCAGRGLDGGQWECLLGVNQWPSELTPPQSGQMQRLPWAIRRRKLPLLSGSSVAALCWLSTQ